MVNTIQNQNEKYSFFKVTISGGSIKDLEDEILNQDRYQDYYLILMVKNCIKERQIRNLFSFIN